MKKIRRVAVVTFTLLICFIFVPVAFAHPLGNFTINHYAGLQVSRDAIAVDFVLDMAEIPAFQEIQTFDANGNGQADAIEAETYHAGKCRSLQPNLSLLLNNKPLDLTLASSSVAFPAGAGGLPTLRLTCEFKASIANAGQMTSLSFADHSYSERIGWREIVVTADGVKLNGDFASTSVSKRLTSYPQDLLSNPLDQREITLGIGSLPTTEQNNSANAPQSIPSLAGSRSDRFTQLITLQNLTLPTVLFALLISFVWGAMHAMTPGHGKTIVGAYLVGSRGTLKHAVYLGLATTITHTLGVFALGLITLFAAQFIVPEKLYPWISLLSGLFVVGIGINLMASRFRSSGLGTWFQKVRTPLVGSSYSPVFEHTHAKGIIHQHKYVLNPSHAEFHNHDGHSHSHSHAHGHSHDHDHADHSHLPPGADGSPITWRNLLALGVSGGLLPCPSALVVLLGAIALNRIGFGLILVLAFSLGLAGALTAIGMLFIYAGRLFNRFPTQGRIIQLLPILSALFVSAIGVGILIKALTDIGIV
ncbi:MAG TPA: sulfite exporter TauE/SafE family protein [Anaerolineales bacterium]|nr:sulfite exporter TauE/SafE family protein [Anaerolineales bacterium]